MSRARPNILMIVADDYRFDAIQALGNEHVETPNIDSLIEDGCAFTRHHNMGADNAAVCAPARAMIHSGRSLFNLDGPGDITTDYPPLAGRFREEGYRTFGTGKWHNGRDAFDRSFAEGEDVFLGGMSNHWNVPVISVGSDDEWPEEKPHRTFSGTGTVWPGMHRYDRYSSGTHSSELFANATKCFLGRHCEGSPDQPFFAYMSAMAPHDPRTAPGEYMTMYDHRDIPLPKNFAPEHPFDNGRLDVRDENLEDYPRESDAIRRHIADYYAMITHLDAQIGDVLDELEKTGERENTVIVFTADHGLAVGQHGLLGKQNLYDHSVRVPFVIAGPGVPEDERRNPLSCHCDIYSTLCDIAGIDAPAGVEGKSLAPTLRNPEMSPRDSLFMAYEDSQRAVRDNRYKLIEYYVDGDRRTQLFDMETDPAEITDLSTNDEYVDVVDRLRDRLAQWQTDLDDPLVDA